MSARKYQGIPATIKARKMIFKKCGKEISELLDAHESIVRGRVDYIFTPDEAERMEYLELVAVHSAMKAIPIAMHYQVKDELGRNGFNTLADFFLSCAYGG